MRNWNKKQGYMHPWPIMGRSLSDSTSVGTRKMVNYIYAGWRQWKFWWRIVTILTCKSFIIHGYRGERLIETSSSWFSSKFPPGKLMLLRFYRIKRMIRGIERLAILNYFQTLNIYTTTCYLKKFVETMEISNGLCFGKQDWRWGMNLLLI